MARKTAAERDRTHITLRLKQASTRQQRIAIAKEWVQVHGTSPEWMWDAFGHAEFVRGFNEGVKDATD